MALTSTQEVALFEILDIPCADTAGIIHDVQGLYATKSLVSSVSNRARGMVRDFLQQMESDLLDAVAGYCDTWISLGTDTTKIEGGSFGAISGITLDPEAERRLIREKVTNLVPFFRLQDSLAPKDTIKFIPVCGA